MAAVRVLVLDDDDASARVLTTVLTAAGFETAATRDRRAVARAVLDENVAVVVASFAGSGIASTTTLAGDLRRRLEPPLRDVGVVALVDDVRDAALGLATVADEVLVRPIAAHVLIDAVTETAATSPRARRARRTTASNPAARVDLRDAAQQREGVHQPDRAERRAPTPDRAQSGSLSA